MIRTIFAGVFYFISVFLVGFGLGIFRTLTLAPYVGDVAAVLIELPVILSFAWLVSKFITQRFGVPALRAQRLLMGAVAFLILMAAEAALSYKLSGRNLLEHLALFRSAPQLLGLAGQVAFALFPVLQIAEKGSNGADDRD